MRAGLGWTVNTFFAIFCYLEFERRLCAALKKRVFAGEFDIVHRVTPVSPAIPSPFLARLCRRAGVPLVIGPINGGVPWPKQFNDVRRADGEWLSIFRKAYKIVPGYKATLRQAACVIVGSKYARNDIPDKFQAKTIYVAENAVSHNRRDKTRIVRRGDFRIVFVGRLVSLKGVDMLIEALASDGMSFPVELVVIGDGPERFRLESLAKHLGIDRKVTFTGWLDSQEVNERIQDFDLLVLPSIREFGGGVILEAMDAGVVPVAIDYGGPGELITMNTGFVVPMGNRDSIIAMLAEVIRSAESNREQLHAMGEACQRRVDVHFTWEAKAKKISRIYSWILDKETGPPDRDRGFCSLSTADLVQK